MRWCTVRSCESRALLRISFYSLQMGALGSQQPLLLKLFSLKERHLYYLILSRWSVTKSLRNKNTEPHDLGQGFFSPIENLMAVSFKSELKSVAVDVFHLDTVFIPS